AVDLLLEVDQLAANAANLFAAGERTAGVGLQARQEVLHLVNLFLERQPLSSHQPIPRTAVRRCQEFRSWSLKRKVYQMTEKGPGGAGWTCRCSDRCATEWSARATNALFSFPWPLSLPMLKATCPGSFSLRNWLKTHPLSVLGGGILLTVL